MKTKKVELALIIFLVQGVMSQSRGLVEESGGKANNNTVVLPTKVHVIVVNYLRDGLDLTLHCMSKDTDMGVKVLPFGTNFTFSFEPKWTGVTLFHCGMQWKWSPVKRFDIFDGVRDTEKCKCYTFIWHIMPLGPCMFNYNSFKFDFCYPWK